MKSELALHLASNCSARAFLKATASRPAENAETVNLPHGAVMRLESSSGVRRIDVKHGLVWLTATPADGDVLLPGGEGLDLKKGWPYVIEALESAELFLVRKKSRRDHGSAVPTSDEDGKNISSGEQMSPP